MGSLEDIIKELIELDGSNKVKKKDIVIRLAKELKLLIEQKNYRILNQLSMLNLDEDPKSIAHLINWICKKNKLSISRTWILNNLPREFKQEKGQEKSEEKPVVRLTDNFITEHKDELLERIKELTKGPAQDIKIKVRRRQ